MDDCLFCKIVAGDIPAEKVYEDDAVLAFLDIHPVNPGHVLVIPKAHSEGIVDASDEALAAVMRTVKRIVPGVLKAVAAEGYNVGVNQGKVAGQVIFHLHVHLMPRFPEDGHRLWHGKDTTPDELKSVAEKIRKHLQ